MDVSRHLTLKPGPQAILDLLPERADRPRFLELVGGQWASVSYGSYAEQARDLGLYLEQQGIGAETRAAIFGPNSSRWAAAALAIQSVGGALVPIYPSNTSKQAAYIVEHSDAKVV